LDDAGAPVDFTALTLRASIQQGKNIVSATSVTGDSVGVVTVTFASAETRQLLAAAGRLQVQVIDGAARANIIIEYTLNIGPSNFLR